LSYDRIWESSRSVLPKMWKAEYPPEEMRDDIENYRGLGLIHACQKLKLSVWRLGVARANGRDIKDSKARLWIRIEDVGEVFC
jgi:hypothetical protein